MKSVWMEKAKEYKDVVKTGQTHLMDAMPVTLKQEFEGYARQIELGILRIEDALKRMYELPQGGTAVGTGINTHKEVGNRIAREISKATNRPSKEAENHFESQETVDARMERAGT